jgi:hypothetical protein
MGVWKREEVNGTMILPPLVFPGQTNILASFTLGWQGSSRPIQPIRWLIIKEDFIFIFNQ